MAIKKDKKQKYAGPRTAWDTAGLRAERDKRLERARKNSTVPKSNEIFALEDEAFKKACTDAGVKPTARQASKYRQPGAYGLAAQAAGKSTRRASGA